MSTLFLHVTNVRHLGDYALSLTFSDGSQREVDLRDELTGEVFEPLQEVDRFAEVFVDEDTRTVAWPSGADFAPEFLYERSREPTSAS